MRVLTKNWLNAGQGELLRMTAGNHDVVKESKEEKQSAADPKSRGVHGPYGSAAF
jgi:hypothetical protein